MRNLICHGSWRAPEENSASVHFYVTGKPGQQQVCDTPVTVACVDGGQNPPDSGGLAQV